MSAQADALMSIFGMKRMTCASCSHSELYWAGTDFVLCCAKTGRKAEATCEAFQYEPGSDEGEL